MMKIVKLIEIRKKKKSKSRSFQNKTSHLLALSLYYYDKKNCQIQLTTEQNVTTSAH